MKDERLVAAFDAVTPDDEEFDLVWDRIEAAYDAEAAEATEAAAAMDGEVVAGQGDGERAERGAGFTVTPGQGASRKRSTRRGWIPAVAAVLVLAIGVGVGLSVAGKGSAPFASKDAGTVETEQAAEASGGALSAPVPAPDMPAPAEGIGMDGYVADTAEEDGTPGIVVDEEGREYSARTLLVGVDPAAPGFDQEALLAEYRLTLRNSWENQDIIVIGLDHDATLEELRQLKTDLEAEPGVVYVEFDGIAHIMGEQ